MKAFIEFLGENSYIISFYRGKYRVAYIIFAIVKILYGGISGTLALFGIRYFPSMFNMIIFLPWGFFSLVRSIYWKDHKSFLHILQFSLSLFVSIAIWLMALILLLSISDTMFLPHAIVSTVLLLFLILHFWYEKSQKQNCS